MQLESGHQLLDSDLLFFLCIWDSLVTPCCLWERSDPHRTCKTLMIYCLPTWIVYSLLCAFCIFSLAVAPRLPLPLQICLLCKHSFIFFSIPDCQLYQKALSAFSFSWTQFSLLPGIFTQQIFLSTH